MSTQVKVISRDGRYGLIMHQHGDSAWHPANEVHTARVGRTAHQIHAAGSPGAFEALAAYATAAVSRETLEHDYHACLAGTPQPYWNAEWKAKLAARQSRLRPLRRLLPAHLPV